MLCVQKKIKWNVLCARSIAQQSARALGVAGALNGRQTSAIRLQSTAAGRAVKLRRVLWHMLRLLQLAVGLC